MKKTSGRKKKETLKQQTDTNNTKQNQKEKSLNIKQTQHLKQKKGIVMIIIGVTRDYKYQRILTTIEQ